MKKIEVLNVVSLLSLAFVVCILTMGTKPSAESHFESTTSDITAIVNELKQTNKLLESVNKNLSALNNNQPDYTQILNKIESGVNKINTRGIIDLLEGINGNTAN